MPWRTHTAGLYSESVPAFVGCIFGPATSARPALVCLSIQRAPDFLSKARLNRLALRNLFRNRVRSAVILGTIAFSTVVLVVAAGFIEWIFATMREWAVQTGTGHVQVMQKDFLTRGTADPFSYLMPAGTERIDAIAKLPHVTSVGRRLNVGGLISFKESTMSFVGAGVEPAKEEIVTRNLRFDSGSNLDASSTDEIVVGQGLARNLGLETGARVVLVSTTSNGGVNAVELTVRGIFTSQIKAFDEVAVRMPLAVAQRLLRVKGTHAWVVSLDDVDATDGVASAIRVLPGMSTFDVVRWIDLSDFFTKTVNFLSGQLGMMRVFIGLIVVLGVSNMLIMNVLERTGEIGTLLALGNRRSKVVQLFLVESFYLGLLGSTLGVVASLACARIISAIGVPMPPPPGWTEGYLGAILVTWPIVLIAFTITAVTTLAAGLYPARKASRMVVVDALRHNR